jgi:hypothetical protein
MLSNLIGKVSTLNAKSKHIYDYPKEDGNLEIIFTLHPHQKHLCQTTS